MSLKIAKQMYDDGHALTSINRYLLNEGGCSAQQAFQIIKEISLTQGPLKPPKQDQPRQR